MLKKIAKGLLILVSVSLVGACAANTVNGVKENTESFNVLNNDDGVPSFGKGHHFKKFAKELNLTQEQKDQFNALKEEMKSNFDKTEMKNHRELFKNTLKEAFLSEKINKDELKSKLQALKPQDDKRVNLMANNLIKAYSILNSEQKTKVESKLNEMESKFQNMSKSPIGKMFGFFKDKRFDWFTNDLNLNETQKADLKSLFDSGMGDRSEMFEKMKGVKNTILTELKSTTPNSDKIASTLKDMRGGIESKMDTKLDKLIKLHDTLNVEQRQKLVNKIESMISKMKKHSGGKHFHG